MTKDNGRIANLLRRSSSVAARLIVTLPLVGLCAGLAFMLRPLGVQDLANGIPTLTFVDRNGALLGTILGGDERQSAPVPLAAMAPSFIEALIAAEDRRFTAHGALDPVATLRALANALRDGRAPHGASTLTMQLARQLFPIDSDLRGKVIESVVAFRLENGLSKAHILEAYANRAPMGSNLYGVEAAARSYFGTTAERLDLAQSALLAALPNDPVRLDPYRHFAAAHARAVQVLAAMRANGAIDAATQARAAREHLALQPRGAGIVAAAHALFYLAPRVAAGRDRVRTTLDRPLQRFVEEQVRTVVRDLAAHEVRQAAAVVVDNERGEVLAYAGSADYFDVVHGGRNDGVQALRQPGSALKPFLYERALERGVIRPTTILADEPVTYALPGARSYRPVDYSDRFAGPVRPRIALANSLNVPAVRVLERNGVDDFLTRLRVLGFTHLTRRPSYYGLGLTLGGGEVSLYELARAYATLARGGVPTPLVTTLDGSVAADAGGSVAPGNPAWAFVTDVLADPVARSAAFGTRSILTLPFPAAVKTGTSSDFRDTWAAGFTRRYTVAVWVGNFDGHPMRGISGVTGAGPLWNRIMLHLHEDREPAAFAPPRGYTRVTICATTGLLPGPACPAVARELLDARDLARVRAAPRAIASDAGGPAKPRILFPRDGDRFVADARARLEVEVSGRGLVRLWLDGHRLVPRNAEYVVAVREGSHRLVARGAAGTSIVNYWAGPPPVRARAGFSVVAR